MKNETKFSLACILLCVILILTLISLVYPLYRYAFIHNNEYIKVETLEYIERNFELFLEEFQDSGFSYALAEDEYNGSTCLEIVETNGYRYRFGWANSIEIFEEKYPPQYADMPNRRKVSIEVDISTTNNETIRVECRYATDNTWCCYLRDNIENSYGLERYDSTADSEIMDVTTPREIYDMCDKAEALQKELDEWASNKQAALEQQKLLGDTNEKNN